MLRRLVTALLAACALTGAGGFTASAGADPRPVDDTVAPPTGEVITPPTVDDVEQTDDEPAPVIDLTEVPDESIPLVTGPVVSIQDQDVEIGDQIIVTVAGFESQFLNVAICGNEARRGSGDCNMRSSQGVELDPGETGTQFRMRIAAPPTMCPCLIRAASNAQSEVAIAPIQIFGHGIAVPLDPPEIGPFVEATISVAEAESNALQRLKTALGGTTTYDVFVTARNTLTTPLDGLSAAASVGRGDIDDLTLIELAPIPGTLEPGQRWQQVVQVDLPRLNIGEAEWRLVVSGAGAPIEATQTTSNTPTALYVLAVLLVFDIAYILFRMRRRKQRARTAAEPERTGPVIDVDDEASTRPDDATGSDPADADSEHASQRDPDTQPIEV